MLFVLIFLYGLGRFVIYKIDNYYYMFENYYFNSEFYLIWLFIF